MPVDISPTLAGFLLFVRNVMGVPVAELPDDDSSIELAFVISQNFVNPQINDLIPILYTNAVYNLAGDNLVSYAQDQPGSTYWSNIRKQWNIYQFIPGVVQSTSDEGTSVSYVVQDAASQFTLSNLQNLKTPWGRAYLAIAQEMGPSVWGVS